MLLRRRVELIEAGVLLALMAILAVFFVETHPDRAYIAYRYARNLASGRGLLYNVGQPPFLSGVASAPYAFLLSIGAFLWPDIPTLANVLGLIAIAAGGVIVSRMAAPAGRLPALLAGGVFITFPLVWVCLGLETPLWLALCLAAIGFHLRGAGTGGAVCLGLATLIRPDAAVLAALLAVHALLTHRSLVFLPAGVFAGITGLGGLIVLSTYQKGGIQSAYLSAALAVVSPDALGPDVLTGLGGLGIALFALSPLWAILLILCGLGLSRIRQHPWAMLLGVWAGLHLVLLGVLGAGVTAKDFAPLVPMLAGLAALGAEIALARVPEDRFRWVAYVVIVLLTAGTALYSSLVIAATPPVEARDWRAWAVSTPDPRIEAAAAWLRQNAPPQASVAAARVGPLGYQVEQPMVDFYGALQVDAGDAAGRGDAGWWLMAYSPDYVTVDRSELSTAGGAIIQQDDWFAANYAQVTQFGAGGASPSGGELLIFQRTTPPQTLTGSLIGFTTFPGGLTVNGIASDFSLFPFEGGRTGLVRLEWLLNAPVPALQTITIRIQGRGGGAVAGLATRSVDFSRWPQHELVTTFHPIMLSPSLPSGVYDVQVGIGSDAENQTWKSIAVAKVPFLGGTDLGGISGTRAEFGDITLLGYRVGQRPEGLEVFLLWQAARTIAADYHINIQVRDTSGAIVSSQDVQPHNGAYPTSVWSPGEQVTDTVLLPVSQVPPGEYDVYVGLSTPDGAVVRTADGQDAVFVGHITLASP